MLLRDPLRWKRFLWLCALDQTFAAALPLAELVAKTIPATWQTIGPIPLSAALVAIYVAGARARG
jgi:hypothetical protein